MSTEGDDAGDLSEVQDEAKNDEVEKDEGGEADDVTAGDEKKKALSKRIRKAAQKTKRLKNSDSPPPKRKKKSKVTHPRTLDMAIEAIENLADPRGSSIQAIKNYILNTFPTVRPDMIKSMLKLGLEQGFKEELLVRPRGQENTPTLAGRYKVTKKGGNTNYETERQTKIAAMKPKAAVSSPSAKKKSLKKKVVEPETPPESPSPPPTPPPKKAKGGKKKSPAPAKKGKGKAASPAKSSPASSPAKKSPAKKGRKKGKKR